MSFGPNMRQAADESQPLELRYMALRHALTYTHLGFNIAWSLAESRFDIRKGVLASSSALKQAADFFIAERKAWITLERARISYIRKCRALGLPPPRVTVERTWAKAETLQSGDQP